MDQSTRLARVKYLSDNITHVLNDPNATADQKGAIEGQLTEIKTLQGEIKQVKEIERIKAEFDLEAKSALPVPQQEQKAANFKNWGEYLAAVGSWAIEGKRDSRLKAFRDVAPEEGKDMTGQTGAAGGFLMEPEFQAQLMSAMGPTSLIRSRATVIRMRRRQIDIPVLDQTSTTAGVPHWFGGIQAYWTEENTQNTQSDVAFRKISLVARKLTMYTRASDELLDDAAISLSDFLSGPMGFAGAIAFHEDYTFLRGNGVGQPLGIVNSPATINVARATPSTVKWVDLVNMLTKFMPSGRGVWMASQSVLPQLLQMAGPTDTGYAGTFLWGSANAGVPNSLLGMPIIFTEKLPVLGTAGDLILVDPNFYLVGDRQATTVESTKYDRWRYDETSWKAVHRVDGQPWLSAPITYQDGSTQISPFVRLGS